LYTFRKVKPKGEETNLSGFTYQFCFYYKNFNKRMSSRTTEHCVAGSMVPASCRLGGKKSCSSSVGNSEVGVEHVMEEGMDETRRTL